MAGSAARLHPAAPGGGPRRAAAGGRGERAARPPGGGEGGAGGTWTSPACGRELPPPRLGPSAGGSPAEPSSFAAPPTGRAGRGAAPRKVGEAAPAPPCCDLSACGRGAPLRRDK